MRQAYGSITGALIVAASCARAPATPSAASAVAGTYMTTHFAFQYTARDADGIAAMAAEVEAQQSRIVADIGSSAMPVVNVTLYSDHDALAAAVRSAAGPIPAWASGLATEQNQIHMMSPNAAGSDTSRNDTGSEKAASSLRL